MYVFTFIVRCLCVEISCKSNRLPLSNIFFPLKYCTWRKYAPKCNACNQLIIPKEDGTDSYNVECLGRSYHENCYRCEVGTVSTSKQCTFQEQWLICKHKYKYLLSPVNKSFIPSYRSVPFSYLLNQMSTAVILWMEGCFANLAIWAWFLASTNTGWKAQDKLQLMKIFSFKEMGDFCMCV